MAVRAIRESPLREVGRGYFLRNRSCRLSPTPPIMKMAVRAIRESPLREVGRGYFLRNRSCRLSPTPPIMKIGLASSSSHGRCRGLDSGLRRNLSCSLAACTTSNENVCGAEAGNHKGCPYSGFAGTYFHSSRSCRLSPTPPIMKMAVRAIRESPLREVGRGYFLRNRSCSLTACTTSNENGCGPEAGNHKGCPYSGFAGTYFHTNRSCRLSPTPPIMKMAVRAIRESPLREVGRGYFLRNHSAVGRGYFLRNDGELVEFTVYSKRVGISYAKVTVLGSDGWGQAEFVRMSGRVGAA